MYLRDTPIPAEEKPEAVEVRVEADLARHELPTLVGIIDLVRPGGSIVDFKTSAAPRTPSRSSTATKPSSPPTASSTGRPLANRSRASSSTT